MISDRSYAIVRMTPQKKTTYTAKTKQTTATAHAEFRGLFVSINGANPDATLRIEAQSPTAAANVTGC